MKPRFYNKFRWLRLLVPIVLAVAVCLCLTLWFTPIAKWLIVDKTLEVYQATDTIFANGDNEPTAYQGIITDTIIKTSGKDKAVNDTILHRQAICIKPERGKGDRKPGREDLGVFGDSAGLLNAIFSFLAFVAVLATICLQLKKDGHDKRYGARMQFEQEFFAMVGMLEDIVSHLRIEITEPQVSAITQQEAGKLYGQEAAHEEQSLMENKTRMVEGRDVFRYIYKDRSVTNLLNYVNKDEAWYSSKEAQENCFDGTLDHYFRYLYRILKHIDESELLDMLADTENEREKYAHLLRAQLSNYELLMLFYNGLLGEHKRTIKKLIERYGMFNNLRIKELGDKHRHYYKPIADGTMYANPIDFNNEEMYDISAFWDKKGRERIKKEIEKEGKRKKPCLCKKCIRKMKVYVLQEWEKMKNWCDEEPKEDESAPKANLALEVSAPITDNTAEQKKAKKKEEPHKPNCGNRNHSQRPDNLGYMGKKYKRGNR